tara:strand:- start:36 stop:569 length:534 start_codon:yes stop_codon:yes gene_type:complete
MILTLANPDKMIIKDGVPVEFNIKDENDEFVRLDEPEFWENYTSINAIQINTEGESTIEFLDKTQRAPTQSEIDVILNKYNEVKESRDAQEAADLQAFHNSWERVRIDRDHAISLTDKYLLNDYAITEENLTAIKNYRTALRDLPQTYSSEEPINIQFDENQNVNLSGNRIITKPIF